MDYSQIKTFELRRKFWKFFGAEIYVSNPAAQNEIGFIKMKAWKLREDVRLFTDRSMQREVLQIHARQIIDFGATYDVIDSSNQQVFFSMRRKGLKSTFVRDHWLLFDVNNNQFGSIEETSSGLALARRWIEIIPYVGPIIGLVLSFVPQTYNIQLLQANGSQALGATITHRKNPFIVKMLVDSSMAQVPVHPFVPLASGALLSVIDAVKQ